ncbi:hypothetical protein GCM10010172_80080 [Paractinoplanes ferrugineus]|uniref:Uncharacterized protein n=1 Tax=Paractinoplanes ferrugineus TaxID=113564 RepID=A0A919JAY3_9ACTN|nr:hypothetical protein [Actinoplanes ferrugineus]GIE16724.1 hypothetical protein Afe05nite_85640 [Actinoplanes ferrugineus]
MTTDTVTLGKEAAQRLFDALCNSMDFGSGFLETDDVEALREMAVAIGVDPNVGTPDEFKAGYPHPFEGESDRRQVAWMFDAFSQSVRYSVTNAPYTVNDIDDSRMPDFTPCKVGSYGRRCAKPESNPIHQAESATAR